MTAAMTEVREAEASTRQQRRAMWLRASLWALHVLMAGLAVLSVAGGADKGFGLWVDLRKLGPAAIWAGSAWAISVLGAAVCAGPWIGGWIGKGRWMKGLWPALAWWLLWPSYFMLACLVANTANFYRLLSAGRGVHVDGWVPATLDVALVMGAWVLLTREWLRQTREMSAEIGRGLKWAAAAFAVLVIGIMAASFWICSYERPIDRPVDLAVVLGWGVRNDGKANAGLTARTMVAVDLYRRGMVKHILLSGMIEPPRGSRTHELSEVTAMKEVCLEAGIPADAISLDPVGVNTRATAADTKSFMHEKGFTSVVVCSADFHLMRTVASFREVGIDAYAMASRPVDWPCANPQYVVREVVANAVYWMFPSYREAKAVAMQLSLPRVVVRKSARVLELYDGDKLVKSYPCISGGNGGDKAIEGDRKTPVGQFRIVFKNPESKFHLSLGLDYPNREDAERGLASGLISRAQYDGIIEALGSDLSKPENQKKLWYTPLGGEIFIHGHMDGRSGTAGCVAMSNEDVEELYAILPIGTHVGIEP